MPVDHGVRPIDRHPYARSAFVPDDNLDNFALNWTHYRDRIAIFLGAGASVGARSCFGSRPFPMAFHLRNDIWQKFMVTDSNDFRPDHLGTMSLEHASALVERSVGRDALVRKWT